MTPGKEPKSLEDAVRESYVPKNTPDTIFDYLGKFTSLVDVDRDVFLEKLEKIPDARLENLGRLVEMFIEVAKEAGDQPGHYIDGNPILGGPVKEYVPSTAEVLLSEIGDRIKHVVETNDPGKIKEQRKIDGIHVSEIRYTPVQYYHADVMGSGRFFYAEKAELVQISL